MSGKPCCTALATLRYTRRLVVRYSTSSADIRIWRVGYLHAFTAEVTNACGRQNANGTVRVFEINLQRVFVIRLLQQVAQATAAMDQAPLCRCVGRVRCLHRNRNWQQLLGSLQELDRRRFLLRHVQDVEPGVMKEFADLAPPHVSLFPVAHKVLTYH